MPVTMVSAVQPTHFVHDIRWLNDSTFVLRVDRHDLRFKAGQSISLGVWKSGVNREYSIYSSEDDTFLELLIRRVEGGAVTPNLAQLLPGDPVYVAGPYSDFVLRDLATRSRPHVLICSGTGIAPFHSFVTSCAELNYRILHGVRQLDDRIESDHYAADRYIACVSRQEGGHFQGRVTSFIDLHPVSKQSIVYLCGNRNMIIDTYELLRKQGVSNDNIYSEVFF